MNHVLLLCRSVTQAQRISLLLSADGISARIFRAPAELSDKGCSYSVKIREQQLPRALALMRKAALQAERIFLQEQDGRYTEVVTP